MQNNEDPNRTTRDSFIGDHVHKLPSLSTVNLKKLMQGLGREASGIRSPACTTLASITIAENQS
nr:hypothetical protein Itr_chr15CG12180 [Ipomoea trifida]